mmetsp:Transcript_11929/g.51181  ORF Transcript_11929/g.51181 Transcript_11929/m.51181 type:complete len:300 (+) Transcript_11929:1732-2631(+)
MHQSRMFSSHRNHVGSMNAGMISRSFFLAASQASAAIAAQFTHHCGLSMGSMTSFEREHKPSRIGFAALPSYRPSASSASITALRAANRFRPLNLSPPSSLIRPSSVSTLTKSKSCRLPVSKSLGSCAGVIFTAPVPKDMSTSVASQMTGMRRPLNGCTSILPCACVYRASSGCTATAVSPSIVSGRVVATTILPSAFSSNSYAKDQIEPNSTLPSWPGTTSSVLPSKSMWSTSMSEIAVFRRQHQFTRRLSRYTRPSACMRTKASFTALDSVSSIVKRSRDQSREDPRRRSWLKILPP